MPSPSGSSRSGGRALEYVGGFAEFVVQREERLRRSAGRAAHQQRQSSTSEQFIDRFRYKATKARQVQSRIKTLEKLDRIEAARPPQLVAKFGSPSRSARPGWWSRWRTSRWAIDGRPVLRASTWSLSGVRSGRWIGPNGAGKSTLVSCCWASWPGGPRPLGANVDVAYFAQHQVDALDRTVVEDFRAAVGEAQGRNLRTVLGGFGFRGDAVDR